MSTVARRPEDGRLAPPAPAPGAGKWVLTATILGSSMAFIDGGVVNVALPVLQRDFGATVIDAQWVIEAYTLLLAALLLVGGSLGDHFGRRRVYAVGVALFTAASIWCGLAPSIGQLILARIVQGVGGALLVPGSLAIISAYFSGAERGRAIGTWSAATTITAALGPVLGGYLIEHASWRWVFFINAPLAALVLVLVIWGVPESRDPAAQRLDWLGALLGAAGLGALTYGLINAGAPTADPLTVGATLAVAVVLLGLFLLVEARGREPMMPLTLFRARTFSGANLLTFLLYGALAGAFFFVPFNLIQVQGYSTTAAGAAGLPFVLLLALLSRFFGGRVARYGPRRFLIAGPAVVALGFALFALPGRGGSYWTTFFPPMLVMGLGMAITVAPLTTTVMAAVPSSHAGLASGVNNAVSRAAGLIAIAVLGLVVLGAFNAGLDTRLGAIPLAPAARQALDAQRIHLAAAEPPPGLSPALQTAVRGAVADSFVDAFRVVMLLAAGLALAAGSAALLVEDRPRAP